jgi:two-component system response regulator
MNNNPILLVEDSSDDVIFTLRAFRKNNITNEIVIAGDGEEALDLLLPKNGAPPLRPALVLLDVQMPKIDGIEVLRRIRADPRTQSLPVVMLTTSNEGDDVIKSYQLGANSFVRKPVAFSDFLTAASLLGMYWLMLNEPAQRDPETAIGNGSGR